MRGGKGSEGGREGAEVSGRLGRRHGDDLTQELLRGLEEGRLVVGRERRLSKTRLKRVSSRPAWSLLV